MEKFIQTTMEFIQKVKKLLLKFYKFFVSRIVNPIITFRNPITENDEWKLYRVDFKKHEKVFQSIRVPSFLKHVSDTGEIYYRYLYEWEMIEIENGTIINSESLSNILDNLYPITLPFYCKKPKRIFCLESLLAEDLVGCYDIVQLKYFIDSNGKKVDVSRNFEIQRPDFCIELTDVETYCKIDEWLTNLLSASFKEIKEV